MRKLTALICLILCFAMLAGCGQTADAGKETVPTDDGVRDVVSVQEPVTVEFWHVATGQTGELLQQQINTFNETNGMGITVVGTYKGSYGDILDTVKAGYGSGTLGDIIMTSGGSVDVLGDAGVLADLSGYVERDGFDMEQIPESLRYYGQYFDGKIIQFPYMANASVVYYNKAYYPDGFPTTLEAWISAAQTITQENPDVYGMGLPLDAGYIQRPLVRSLGSVGYTANNGTEPGCLEDGTLQTLMTDWLSWIDGGYCLDIKNTDFPAALMSGQLAAFPISCVNTPLIMDRAKKAGIELGCAPCVAYGGQAGGLGGGGICVLESSSDTPQLWLLRFSRARPSLRHSTQTSYVMRSTPLCASCSSRSYTAVPSPLSLRAVS